MVGHIPGDPRALRAGHEASGQSDQASDLRAHFLPLPDCAALSAS